SVLLIIVLAGNYIAIADVVHNHRLTRYRSHEAFVFTAQRIGSKSFFLYHLLMNGQRGFLFAAGAKQYCSDYYQSGLFHTAPFAHYFASSIMLPSLPLPISTIFEFCDVASSLMAFICSYCSCLSVRLLLMM